jgi:hypothetical protein
MRGRCAQGCEMNIDDLNNNKDLNIKKSQRAKQECGSLSLQPSLRCHTLAFFAGARVVNILYKHH